ncbi:MAG: hypothetical protein ABI747_02365 [Candidatus Moraniibacteriota bacterium]
MDKIDKGEPIVASESSSEIRQEESGIPEAGFRSRTRNLFEGFKKFTSLEMIGMVALVILVVNMLFDVSVTVTRSPLLQKILGKTTSQSLPPQLATDKGPESATDPALLAAVIPTTGVELPATWGDLGKQMVASGVIDPAKFQALYKERGGLPIDMQKMLLEGGNEKIKITAENSGTILNLLWALGLGNKNEILDLGEMQKKEYGGAGKFASTGGWTLSTGKPMDHYSMHRFIRLTTEQQARVEKVSRGVFRPCCGNSTHFPDCNHGMAMLALLELMASQGVSEQDMYKAALTVNSYWFPDNYLTIASFFKKQGTSWDKVSPEAVLSAEYSSAQGYQKLLTQVTPEQAPRGKGGCGV